MDRLPKSVGLAFSLTDEGETLMTLCSHHFMSENTRTALAFSEMFLSAVAFTASGGGFTLSNGGNLFVAFDPYSFIDLALELAYFTGNDKFYFAEAFIDPQTLESLGEGPNSSSFDRALGHYFYKRIDEKGYGTTFFKWKDKTVLGYARKKMYHLIAF